MAPLTDRPFGPRPFRMRQLALDPAAEMSWVRSQLEELRVRPDAQLVVSRAVPTAAFTRRDLLLPGYADAVKAVEHCGYTAVVRPVGGHLAVYDEGSLVFHLLATQEDARAHIRARFAGVAELVAEALRSLSVDARVGRVPGEYCDGEYSVNDTGRTKLMGTGQRIVVGGYLFSAVLMVRRPPLAAVALSHAYAALGLSFDPATVGAVADTVPDVTVDQVGDRILATLRGAGPEMADIDAESLWPAREKMRPALDGM